MAGDDAVTQQETGKPALTTTSAINYLLKNAATVDEALELLRGIDMHSDIGAAHHYAIADASGKSVVVENRPFHARRGPDGPGRPPPPLPTTTCASKS